MAPKTTAKGLLLSQELWPALLSVQRSGREEGLPLKTRVVSGLEQRVHAVYRRNTCLYKLRWVCTGIGINWTAADIQTFIRYDPWAAVNWISGSVKNTPGMSGETGISRTLPRNLTFEDVTSSPEVPSAVQGPFPQQPQARPLRFWPSPVSTSTIVIVHVCNLFDHYKWP